MEYSDQKIAWIGCAYRCGIIRPNLQLPPSIWVWYYGKQVKHTVNRGTAVD